MDYKEKYEDALNRAKIINPGTADYEVAVKIFPELKESEDEKIRKELIKLMKQMSNTIVENYTTIEISTFVSWLEKQKDHEDELEKAYKTADEVQYRRGYEAAKREFEKQGEQKSEINDNILLRFAFYQYDDDTLYLSSVFVEECSRKRGYGSKILKAAEEVAKTLGVSKIRLKVERNTWMEEWYKKNGYEHLCSEGEYDWLEKRIEQKHAECRQCRQETKPNGGIVYEDFNDGDGYYKVDLAYLSKSQVELIENLVASWQNHTNNIGKWSEEDENMLQKALSIIRYALSIPADKEDDPCFAGSSTIDWLKSLKQRMKGETK